MEAIKAFFTKLNNAYQHAANRLTDYLRSAFYSLSVRVFGQDRTDSFLVASRHRYQSIQAYFSDRIDRQSAYYKPISLLWKTTLWGFLAVAFYIFCIETNFLWLMGSMPSVEDLQNPKVNQSSEIYTSDGVMIGKFYTENRTPVALSLIHI